MSGYDYLQAMVDGEIDLPPLLHTLGFEEVILEKDKVTFTFTPQEYHYDPIGTVHGGVICTVLGSATGCTLHAMLPAGTGYTTLELKTNFLKAVTIKTGKLSAVGKVLNLGGRTALVEV